MGTWRSRCTPQLLAQPSPNYSGIVCGNRASIPGPCTYSYKSASCLSAGPGVSPWARGNGGVFASKRAWPASAAGAAAQPCAQPLQPILSQTTATLGALDPIQDAEGDALVTSYTQASSSEPAWSSAASANDLHCLCPTVGRIRSAPSKASA